jgi:hypothetical protein
VAVHELLSSLRALIDGGWTGATDAYRKIFRELQRQLSSPVRGGSVQEGESIARQLESVREGSDYSKLRQRLSSALGCQAGMAWAAPATLILLQKVVGRSASYSQVRKAAKRQGEQEREGGFSPALLRETEALMTTCGAIASEAARQGRLRPQEHCAAVWALGRMMASRRSIEGMLDPLISPIRAVSLVAALSTELGDKDQPEKNAHHLANLLWGATNAGVALPPALVGATVLRFSRPGAAADLSAHDVSTILWALIQQPMFWGGRDSAGADSQWFREHGVSRVQTARAKRWTPGRAIEEDERLVASLGPGRQGIIQALGAKDVGEEHAGEVERLREVVKRRGMLVGERERFVRVMMERLHTAGAIEDLNLTQIRDVAWTASVLRNYPEALKITRNLSNRLVRLMQDGALTAGDVCSLMMSMSQLESKEAEPFLREAVHMLAPSLDESSLGAMVSPEGSAARSRRTTVETRRGHQRSWKSLEQRATNTMDSPIHVGAILTHESPEDRVNYLLKALFALTRAGYSSERLAAAAGAELAVSWRAMELKRLPAALFAITENLGAARARGLLYRCEPGAALFAGGVTAEPQEEQRGAAAEEMPLEGLVQLAEAYAEARLQPPSVFTGVLSTLKASSDPAWRRAIGRDQCARMLEALAAVGMDDAVQHWNRRVPEPGTRRIGRSKSTTAQDSQRVPVQRQFPVTSSQDAAKIVANTLMTLRGKILSSLVSKAAKRERARRLARGETHKAKDPEEMIARTMKEGENDAVWRVTGQAFGEGCQPVFLAEDDALFSAAAAFAASVVEETITSGQQGAPQTPVEVLRVVKQSVENLHPSIVRTEEGQGMVLPRLRMAALAALRHDPGTYSTQEWRPMQQFAEAVVLGQWEAVGKTLGLEQSATLKGLGKRWSSIDGFAPWRSPVRPCTMPTVQWHPGGRGNAQFQDGRGYGIAELAPLVTMMATGTSFQARQQPLQPWEIEELIEWMRQVERSQRTPGTDDWTPEGVLTTAAGVDLLGSVYLGHPRAYDLSRWTVPKIQEMARLLERGGAARASLLDAAGIWSRENLVTTGVTKRGGSLDLEVPPGWEVEDVRVWAAPSPGVRLPLMVNLRSAARRQTLRVLVDIVGAEEEVASWPPGARQAGNKDLPFPLNGLVLERERLGPYVRAVNDVLEKALYDQSGVELPDKVMALWLKETEWDRLRMMADGEEGKEPQWSTQAPGQLALIASQTLQTAQGAKGIAMKGWDGSRKQAAVPGMPVETEGMQGILAPVTEMGRQKLAGVVSALLEYAIEEAEEEWKAEVNVERS